MPKTSQIPIPELDEDVRAHLIAVLRPHGVRRAGVFGSFARGEQTPESDVDLLIEPSAGTTPFTLARLEIELEEIVGRSIALITFNALATSARPCLREQIQASIVLI